MRMGLQLASLLQLINATLWDKSMAFKATTNRNKEKLKKKD